LTITYLTAVAVQVPDIAVFTPFAISDVVNRSASNTYVFHATSVAVNQVISASVVLDVTEKLLATLDCCISGIS